MSIRSNATGWARNAVCLGVLLAGVSGVALAQFDASQPRPPQTGTRGNPSQNPQQNFPPQVKMPGMPDGIDPGDPARARMEASRARSLNDDRRKRLMSDTDKLLALATELKAEVDKSTKDELSVTVVKKASEMEKLAHDVKERMRN